MHESATFSSPMDCSLSGSSVHGSFQAKVLEWVAISFSVNDATYLQITKITTELMKKLHKVHGPPLACGVLAFFPVHVVSCVCRTVADNTLYDELLF